MRRNDSAVARLRAVLGPGLPDVGQSLVALGIALLASLVAGLTLGAITGTLEDLPGLLILIPAAIGLRGTIFGALGARLGTAIHSGTFRVSGRADTVLGQNVLAAGALTIFASVVLAVLAKVVSVGFGLEHSISVADFVVISLVGGFISSVVVLGLTALLALVPPFLAASGAIGGILSSRLTSKLHLGMLEPDAVPGKMARYDVAVAYVVGFPVFVGASIVADLAA